MRHRPGVDETTPWVEGAAIYAVLIVVGVVIELAAVVLLVRPGAVARLMRSKQSATPTSAKSASGRDRASIIAVGICAIPFGGVWITFGVLGLLGTVQLTYPG